MSALPLSAVPFSALSWLATPAVAAPYPDAMVAAFPGRRMAIKHAVDILVIPITSPIWVSLLGLLALAVAVDGGAVFRSEQRVGRHGLVFRMWKFRVLRRGATGQLAGLLAIPARRRQWITFGAFLDDPRLTKTGRWLCRSGLQDLPQVWNVLRGDMALVGPRARLPGEIRLDPGVLAVQVLVVRPGLIGPKPDGPAPGGSALMARRLRADIAYARQCCLRRDIAILARHCARHCTHRWAAWSGRPPD